MLVPVGRRIALLSFHSHGDRSFLDDRVVALVSGDLARRGHANDLFEVVLDLAEGERDPALRELAERLGAYDAVVYERVWSSSLVAMLRAALPAAIFVACRGEHALDAPADFVCGGDLRASVPALFDALGSDAERARRAPPSDVVFLGSGGAVAGSPRLRGEPERGARPFEPNLRPIAIGPERGPRAFSLEGRSGCPYQADARENPLYAGVELPEGVGRGCAFCTTGQRFEARAAQDVVADLVAQLRFVRMHAPERTTLVLKDQSPFDYLDTLIDASAEAGLGGFTLLLETRADWFVRSVARTRRAIVAARRSGIRLAPYLVGIENFSDGELARFHKGLDAAANVAFIDRLDELVAEAPDVLDLSHAAFGFVLFTPWTTLDDLRANLAGIERTRLDRFRGAFLLSRARLYPDTALYHLARTDGLLAERYETLDDDASARYGYFPATPWRFQDARVGHLASLATALHGRKAARDLEIFRALIEVARDCTDVTRLTVDDVLAHLGARAGAADATRAKLASWFGLHSSSATFAGGWRVGAIDRSVGSLRVRLAHPDEAAMELRISPVAQAAELADGVCGVPVVVRSKHYALGHVPPVLSDRQSQALAELAAALMRCDS